KPLRPQRRCRHDSRPRHARPGTRQTRAAHHPIERRLGHHGNMNAPIPFSRLFSAWTWKMAWRDSRTSRKRLLLFSCSIILGIAALAAVGSLGVNLNRAVEEQAKTLLGADLVLSSRDAFTPEAEDLFRTIGGEQSREISFTTMIYFPRTDGTRLAVA